MSSAPVINGLTSGGKVPCLMGKSAIKDDKRLFSIAVLVYWRALEGNHFSGVTLATTSEGRPCPLATQRFIFIACLKAQHIPSRWFGVQNTFCICRFVWILYVIRQSEKEKSVKVMCIYCARGLKLARKRRCSMRDCNLLHSCCMCFAQAEHNRHIEIASLAWPFLHLLAEVRALQY